MRKDRMNCPSPNTYKVNDAFVKTATASWGFGSSKRDNQRNKSYSGPCPGTYDIISRAVEGPKYGLGLKTLNEFEMKRKQTKNMPGPGTYEAVDCTRAKNKDP